MVLEILLALAALTLWPLIPDAARERQARALVFVPLWGFAIGILLALFDRALAGALPGLVRSFSDIVLLMLLSGGMLQIGLARACDALTGRQTASRAARLAPLLLVVAEIAILATIGDPAARARALVLTTMLSRWSIVPIGYGLRVLDASGLGIPWQGITFREFALSSVIALGLAMSLYDVAGLAAVVALAGIILLLRLLLSRRLGGVSGYSLAAGAALCEVAVFAVLAVLG